MTFVRQAGAAAVLVTFTLSLQCAGMAAGRADCLGKDQFEARSS